jgi:putative drug exporter of the RND superfamily
MKPLARFCHTHRKTVLAAWLLVVIGVSGLGGAVGTRYTNTLSLPGTDSANAAQILKSDFSARSGDSEQIVLAARDGTLRTPTIRRAIEAMLARVTHLPHVRSVLSPYTAGQINSAGTIAFATVALDRQAANVPTAAVRRLITTARRARSPHLSVALDGQAIETEAQGGGSASLAIGAILAPVVLFFAFGRSPRAALLPLVCALAGIAVATGLIDTLTHIMSIASWEPQVAILVALGVGVDYALFILSRHRTGLLAGETPERAAINALDTSGRAVLLAGMTVCVAILGMLLLGVSMLDGVGTCIALAVALTMTASLTLLPALLGFFGAAILPRSERAADTRPGPGAAPFWDRWAGLIERRAGRSAALTLALVLLLALPIMGARLGLPDASTDPASSTSHQAYTLLAKGFGPGFGGPLELVAHFTNAAAPRRFRGLVATLRDQPGVARATPPQRSENGRAAVALLYPTTGPQAAQTTALLERVRASASRATHVPGLSVHIGGDTAVNHDFTRLLRRKLPLFVAVVVAVSFVLLAGVFQSVLIPVLAALMNLLSFGAALGVMTAAFQHGWGKTILGFGHAGPIVSYLPVMMFAILFGLSTDYEVFLISRVHAEWNRSANNSLAVTRGQATTGRIITAAALIMILVFSAFVLSSEFALKQIGLGFVAAILIDAFIIRTALLPAVMHLLGRANWWAPARLKRTHPAIQPSRR